MKNMPLFAAAVLALATAARAEDPPPTKPAAPAPAAAGKHENKVSAEATAAYDKMQTVANRFTGKEATGTLATLVADTETAPPPAKFTFKAPGEVRVESEGGRGGGAGAGGGGRGQGMGRGGGPGRTAQIVLRYALGAFRPPVDAEHDAELVKKDGKDVLSVSIFREGAQIAHTDYVLGADGLPTTATTVQSGTDRSGEKREIKSEYSFTWEKAGATSRLQKLVATHPMGTTTFEISYVDVAGSSFPSGWKSSSDRSSGETRVTELVVDGKKVETSPTKPAAGEPGKTEGGDKDGKENK